MKWPTIEEIEEQLKNVRAIIMEDTDIRLQIYEDGVWFVRIGDAQYDTDHRGYWGAGHVQKRDNDSKLRYMAIYLLSEAIEQEAQSR